MGKQETNRPSWPEYFMGIAEWTAKRSTCDRANVGSVIVKDNRQIAAGYNGAISGQPHCDEAGHLLVNGRCLRSNHSELNALISAARLGISVVGGTIYATHFPCWACFKALLAAGITHIRFKEMKMGGINKAVYDAMFACRGQVEIAGMDGLSWFHYTPRFENDELVELTTGNTGKAN